MKQQGFRYCSTCKSKLQKWGKTVAGTQRWRCLTCTKTQIRKRPDLSKTFILERLTLDITTNLDLIELNKLLQPNTTSLLNNDYLAKEDLL